MANRALVVINRCGFTRYYSAAYRLLHFSEMLGLLCQVLPSYGDFNANITFSIPYANNTQHGQVWQLSDKSEQRFEWYSRGKIIDITISHDLDKKTESYHYMRTELDNQRCYYYQGTEFANFVPIDSEDWEIVGEAYIANIRAVHYRLRGEYVPQEPQGGRAVEVRSYEQNFYVDAETKLPLRWEMQSKSNFNSHYDNYIIEYNSFVNNAYISYNIWEIPEEPNGVKLSRACDATPQDPDTPVGPTFRFLLDDFFYPKKAEPEGAVARNLQALKQIRTNKNHTFSVAANQFIDKDLKQLLRSKTGRKSTNQRSDFDDKSVDFPQQIDWRTQGVTGMVKDQVFCGSCWAFSAVATLESRINVQKLGKMKEDETFVSLSEQQIVDCYWNYTGSALTQSCGCEGGDENAVLASWAKNDTTAFYTEHDYPYIGQNDFCQGELGAKAIQPLELGYRVAGYHTVPKNDINAMKRALASGPVSVGISVTESFLFYAGGIYNDPACSSDESAISHAVNLVGYGMTEDFREYWILKNSWSPLWGLDGYIYVQLQGNICSVLSIGAYVDVERTE